MKGLGSIYQKALRGSRKATIQNRLMLRIFKSGFCWIYCFSQCTKHVSVDKKDILRNYLQGEYSFSSFINLSNPSGITYPETLLFAAVGTASFFYYCLGYSSHLRPKRVKAVKKKHNWYKISDTFVLFLWNTAVIFELKTNKTLKYKSSNVRSNSLSERKISCSSLSLWSACRVTEQMFSLLTKNTSNPLLFLLHEVTSSSGQSVSVLVWHSVAPSPELFITSVSWRIFQKQPSNSREAQQTRLMIHVECLGRSGPFCSASYNCHRSCFIPKISRKKKKGQNVI